MKLEATGSIRTEHIFIFYLEGFKKIDVIYSFLFVYTISYIFFPYLNICLIIFKEDIFVPIIWLYSVLTADL